MADEGTVGVGAPLALGSLVLTAGAGVLLFFVILGGTRDHTPLNDIYFLSADTSAIPGAPKLARWTLWNACETANGRSVCNGVHPAYPFDPPRNFGTTKGVPSNFAGFDPRILGPGSRNDLVADEWSG